MIGRRSRRTREPTQPPRWATARTRPRVLVEHTDATARARLVTALQARGYDVLGCGGPDERAACPLPQGRCPAVDQAEAVVTGLVDRPTGRAIVAAILARYPARPLLVEGAPAEHQRTDGPLHGATRPPPTRCVADALDELLGGR